MDIQSAEVGSTRAFRLGDFLRDQLRNIAPFITLIVLVGFFSIASPSFATLGNLENILQQVSITAIMAVGLTFVILTAEIDLSVGAIANATAIVLTFFTLQPDYVNIANLPMPGASRSSWRSPPVSRWASSPPSASPASASRPSS